MNLKKEYILPAVTVFSFILSVIFIAQFYIILSDNRALSREIRESDYIREQITLDKILSPNDRYLKVTKFYSEIISTYGVKFSPDKGTGENQGLNHYQKADVISETFKLCTLLDVPYMLPFAIATYESSFRPYVQTEYETGMFQHRAEAVAQAMLYFNQLPQAYREKCAFVYNSRDDLKDPVNAIRVELVLLWGLKRDFANDQSYYISANHWGMSRIFPMFAKGIEVPEKFTFNRGTVNEDCRNPLMYYYVINSYLSSFERFDLSVWVETAGFDELYRASCSKLEYGYLEGWKYAQDLLKIAKQVELNNLEYKTENEKLIKKYNEKIKDVDREYARIHGVMMAGKYSDIRVLFNLAKQEFKGLRDDLIAGRLRTYRVIINSLSFLILIFNFSLFVRLCMVSYRRRKVA